MLVDWPRVRKNERINGKEKLSVLRFFVLEVNRNTGGASHADTVTPGLAIKRCKATRDAVDVVKVVARALYAVFLDVLLDILVDFMKLTTVGRQKRAWEADVHE